MKQFFIVYSSDNKENAADFMRCACSQSWRSWRHQLRYQRKRDCTHRDILGILSCTRCNSIIPHTTAMSDCTRAREILELLRKRRESLILHMDSGFRQISNQLHSNTESTKDEESSISSTRAVKEGVYNISTDLDKLTENRPTLEPIERNLKNVEARGCDHSLNKVKLFGTCSLSSIASASPTDESSEIYVAMDERASSGIEQYLKIDEARNRGRLLDKVKLFGTCSLSSIASAAPTEESSEIDNTMDDWASSEIQQDVNVDETKDCGHSSNKVKFFGQCSISSIGSAAPTKESSDIDEECNDELMSLKGSPGVLLCPYCYDGSSAVSRGGKKCAFGEICA